MYVCMYECMNVWMYVLLFAAVEEKATCASDLRRLAQTLRITRLPPAAPVGIRCESIKLFIVAIIIIIINCHFKNRRLSYRCCFLEGNVRADQHVIKY